MFELIEEYRLYEKSEKFYLKELKKGNFSKNEHLSKETKIKKILENAIKNKEYDGFIEFYILKIKENILSKSPLKSIYKENLLLEKKKNQQIGGSRASSVGNELEEKTIEEFSKNKNFLKKIFNVENIDNKELSIVLEKNKRKKTDFFISLGNKRKSFSQKSIQIDRQTNKRGADCWTHLGGTTLKVFFEEFQELKSFQNLNTKEKQVLEIGFRLLSNAHFLEIKELNNLTYSKRENFDYFGNEFLFKKMIDENPNIGLRGDLFEKYFPKEYKIFINACNKIGKDFITYQTMKHENIDFLTIHDEFYKKISVFNVSDVLEFENIVYKTSGIQFNPFIMVSNKGSGKDEVQKSQFQPRIHRKNILKLLKEEVSLTYE